MCLFFVISSSSFWHEPNESPAKYMFIYIYIRQTVSYFRSTLQCSLHTALRSLSYKFHTDNDSSLSNEAKQVSIIALYFNDCQKNCILMIVKKILFLWLSKEFYFNDCQRNCILTIFNSTVVSVASFSFNYSVIFGVIFSVISLLSCHRYQSHLEGDKLLKRLSLGVVTSMCYPQMCGECGNLGAIEASRFHAYNFDSWLLCSDPYIEV